MTRQQRGLVLLGVAAVAAVLLRLLIDRDPATGAIGLAWPEPAWADFRLTAATIAALVGAALSLSGVLLQGALRNPLAAPSVLGVSSGAGLGVMIALYLAHVAGMQSVSWAWPTLLGAGLSITIVVALGRRGRWPDPVSTILAGVIIATMCGAGMVLFQGLVPEGVRGRFLSWAMGTIPQYAAPGITWAMVAALAGGTWWAWTSNGRLDALLLDEASAVSIGASPGPTRLACLVVAGVLTAITVTLCGPLGFVGLVAPHAARLLVGPRHVVLVPGALLAGVALVTGADVLRQVIDLGSGRLPVGVVTTLAGGPFFLWLLRREAGGLRARM